MRYIGFKNFRRFEELKPLPLTPITIFVGGNNSGKSTVVKGLLSILGFLNDDSTFEYSGREDDSEEYDNRLRRIRLSHDQRFYFNKDYYAHIGTSKRALRCGADPKEITFQFGIGSMHYEIVVSIDDDSEESTSGRVVGINILSHTWKYEIRYDLVQWTAEIFFHPQDPEKYKVGEGGTVNEFKTSSLARQYDYFRSFSESISFSVNLPDIHRDSGLSLIEILNSATEVVITASLKNQKGKNGDSVQSEDANYLFSGYESIRPTELSKELKEFLLNSPFWDSEYHRGFGFRGFRKRVRVEYIYAHAVTQTVIYSAKDTNDYLVKTVHDFANSRITHSSKGEKGKLYQFIIKWMGEFGIGKDYSVRSIGGEAHIVKIKNMNGDLVNMADMGMGSIQLMILLFRMGAILDQANSLITTIIILEEPEQNLHPMLQSKLADLLLDIQGNFGLRFIVETHSEYLVRKTQVIVGKRFNTPELLFKNPFRVFYFPSEGQPYDMEYTPSGKFVQPFGEGFFDEAANLHMTVLKNSRK